MTGRVAVLALIALAQTAAAQSLSGPWSATITVNDVEIPFRMDISVDGANVRGCFFNGDDKVPSTSGRIDGDMLVLDFAHYATELRATFKDGWLEGSYSSARRTYAFKAKPFVAQPQPQAPVPSIAGIWEIETQSANGEAAWRLIVKQSGAEASAAILRVDGDTGALTGTYRDGKFVLSHFSGARPALLVLTPASDGTLAVSLTDGKGKRDLAATRPGTARAKGLPEPTDPARHTSVKDPAEPFRFSFPDLDGHVVSNTDARFEGKVVLVSITGSWCPNCHDEAPFLAALYRKYHGEGLEIVALSFEEAEQLKNPTRLRAFISQYGIEYTVLLAGEPSELNAKLPQAVNLDCWPTTFILGRDGRVRGVHAGFPGHASGELRTEAERGFTSSIEGLLAEVAIGRGVAASSTEATRAAQHRVAQEYPFADRQDFEDAKRGLIEALPGSVIHDDAGRVVWDLRPFLAFEGEERPAPDTVNPALWRHAQLNNINGLFEVIPGIYQARGFDVAVATFIRGKSGWIVVDPLSSEESARAALELLFKHEGKLPVTAVIYTHGHADHYLGAGGVIDPDEASRRHVPILAPEGFLEGLFTESVLAGNAMGRRFQFQSGQGIPIGPEGTVDFGQGKVPGSRGKGGLIAPTTYITTQNSSQLLDGTEFVFQRTDGTESPGEMNFWLPGYRALCMSEVVNHGQHNIVTPRGALARDALGWAKYIDAARERWGDQAQVLFATHRWPVWGKDRVIGLLEDHRDLYKYMHDQTVHLANLGYGPAEIAERIRLPEAISRNWSNRGYYGSLKFGSRGVYQRYLGFYDGHPATLDPLPPADLARRYVDAMGGGYAIMAKAQAAYDAGDYRWVAELLRQLVFADPANANARELQAKTFEQLGYQAESALWRNIYLRGAKELREWTPEHRAGTGGRWVTAKALDRYSTADALDYVAVRVDGPRAATANLSIGVELSDTGEQLDLHLARGVLNYELRPPHRTPDVRLHTTRPVLDELLSGELNLDAARGRGQVSLEGDAGAWVRFTAMLDDFSADFPVVTRPPAP